MPEHPAHYFSPDEVNALVPRMEELFQSFWSFRENAQRIMDELRVREKRSGEEPSAKDSAYDQMRKSQAHFLLEQAKKQLDLILEMGCVVKDLEMGLVDFPHLLESQEQEVYLCWKFGEKKVRFWHELDQGYASRKPLARRVPH